mgnify:CR=1 FL=1
MRKFLNRPTSDFIKLGIMLLLGFMVIVSPIDYRVKIFVGALIVLYLLSIFFEQTKNLLVNSIILGIFILAASLLSANFNKTMFVEVSQLFIPSVISIFFGSLAVFDRVKTKYAQFMTCINGIVFLFITSLIIIYTHIISPLIFILSIIVILLINFLIFSKKGEQQE